MKDSYNLIDFIKMYYLDSNIPMYLFSDKKCLFCIPKQTDLTYPPEKYLQELLIPEKRISYHITEYGVYFCSLRLEKTPVSSDECIQKAIRYIQQNTNQHLTVGDVADYVGFSKSYFSAYFKKTLGFSVSAFILRCKLEEGKELLQYTNKSISTISTFLCFSSQSHFHTAFKKQYGITPSEYRKKKDM